MLDIIKNFVTEITNTEEPKELVHSKMQLAEAALMYHVIAVDGIIKEEERNKLAEILARHFDMDASETELLAESARDAENEASEKTFVARLFTCLSTMCCDEREWEGRRKNHRR